MIPALQIRSKHAIQNRIRTRTLDEVRELSQAMQADLWDAVEAGELNLPIAREFALDDAKAAVDCMKSNQHFGKIIPNVAS